MACLKDLDELHNMVYLLLFFYKIWSIQSQFLYPDFQDCHQHRDNIRRSLCLSMGAAMFLVSCD